MIPAQIIYEWRIHAPWSDDDDIEQDLILTRILFAIYSDPFLSKKLAFRGGTCLNKLFWTKPERYSEDLDFVQIHAEPVGKIVSTLRKIIDPLFEIKGKWEARQHSYRIYYSYQAEIGGGKRRIKIEINTREHLVIDRYQQKTLSVQSNWYSGQCEVLTFSLEELLATKLRALYQRRKGRDLFDLWKSQKLNPDWHKVVSIFLKYMQPVIKRIYRDHLHHNLQEKLKDPRFQGDMTSLIVDRKEYDMNKAGTFVIEQIFSRVPESQTKQKQNRKRSV